MDAIMSAYSCLMVVGWPCLSQAEWAAWIQAIFSIVGIFVAVLLSVIQRRADKDLRSHADRLQARSLALVVEPLIFSCREILERVIANIEGNKERNLAPDYVGFSEGLQLGERSRALIPTLHLMDGASRPVQQFFFLFNSAAAQARNIKESTYKRQNNVEVARDFELTVRSAIDHSFKAAEATSRLFE